MVTILHGTGYELSYSTADACDNARLVPREQTAWFSTNNMRNHNLSPQIADTNGVSKDIFLRSDIRRCFDQDLFVPFHSTALDLLHTSSMNNKIMRSFITVSKWISIHGSLQSSSMRDLRIASSAPWTASPTSIF